jgi:hypothetical protein
MDTPRIKKRTERRLYRAYGDHFSGTLLVVARTYNHAHALARKYWPFRVPFGHARGVHVAWIKGAYVPQDARYAVYATMSAPEWITRHWRA